MKLNAVIKPMLRAAERSGCCDVTVGVACRGLAWEQVLN